MLIDRDKLAGIIAERLIEQVQQVPYEYAERFDKENLVESILESILDKEQNDIMETVMEHQEIQLAISEAEIEIRDWKEEFIRCSDERNFLKHYGLNESDFI